MLLLLLEGLTRGAVQSPPVIASLAQQVVAHLSTAAAMPELLLVLLQALLLALVATVTSIAAEPRSVDMHVRVWQHAQDHLQVRVSMLAAGSMCCKQSSLNSKASARDLHVTTRLHTVFGTMHRATQTVSTLPAQR